MKRQYCASAFTIDFKNKKVLLMYNKKLNKWLQPGGHIESYETPIETAIRETFEETGINIKIIGPTFNGKHFEPIATERYINKIGDMIDIQYLAIPVSNILANNENNIVIWKDINLLKDDKAVDEEIEIKVNALYKIYCKDFNL